MFGIKRLSIQLEYIASQLESRKKLDEQILGQLRILNQNLSESNEIKRRLTNRMRFIPATNDL